MKDKYNYDDRRTHVRIPIDVYMHLVLFDKQVPSVLKPKDLLALRVGKLFNLSSSGIGVKTNDIEKKMIPPMLDGIVKIALQFKLPGANDSVDTTAKVVWSEKIENSDYKYLLGLEFDEIEIINRIRLRRFVVNKQLKRSDLISE